MSDKKLNIKAFIDKEFDCEFWKFNSSPSMAMSSTLKSVRSPQYEDVGDYYSPDSDQLREFAHCRPRLNKPQILKDWSWLPDGFIWNVTTIYTGISQDWIDVDSANASSIPSHCKLAIFTCVGVHPDFALHGKEMGLEVVEV